MVIVQTVWSSEPVVKVNGGPIKPEYNQMFSLWRDAEREKSGRGANWSEMWQIGVLKK